MPLKSHPSSLSCEVESLWLANGSLDVHLPRCGVVAFDIATFFEILHVSYDGCNFACWRQSNF